MTIKFIYSMGIGLLSLFCCTSYLQANSPAPPLEPLSPLQPMGDLRPHHRPGLPLKTLASDLGPLANLVGTWVGNGFTLISLPDFSSVPPSTGPAPFRLKLNRTIEILELNTIGADIPNRGVISALGSTTGQPDIKLFGLTYLQRISDFLSREPLHIEPGIWIKIPPTTVFPANPNLTVVRMGTVPHGDSFLAQSSELFAIDSAPDMDVLSSTPISVNGTPFPPGFLDPFLNPPLPPGIKPTYVENPNLLLQDDIAGQTIINTIVMRISSNNPNAMPPVGGILNIPFVSLNANATQIDAVFMIETVQSSDGTTFLQLQYYQTVMLNFLGIMWPHISVATLIKQ